VAPGEDKPAEQRTTPASPEYAPALHNESAPSSETSERSPAQIASDEQQLVPQRLRSLMVGYQAGDGEAAALLIRELSPVLMRYFVHMQVRRDEADDLLQETWLRLHRVRHTYRPAEPLLPWVYAIARRVRIDGYRRSRRIRTRELHVELLPDAGSDKTFEQARHLELVSLLEKLPDGQREVVALLGISGLSLDEVARATCSTVGAVKQKAHRAYRRLRDLLSKPDKPKGQRVTPDEL
jgi:RNA polymerase sigma-70 factor (ECF subfamily)